MPKCYQKLNFPRTFLKEGLHPSVFDFNGAYDLFSFSEVLHEELLSFLKNFPLQPDFVAVFNNKNQEGVIENRMIHSDIYFDKNKSWKDILFGIHYELDDTLSHFHWWDMNDAERIYPDTSNDLNRKIKFRRLNGIHYGSRGRLGKFENSVLLESVQITGPTLVRTDIPHCVTYQNPNRNRLSFSLRFKSDFQNWNDVLDFFKDFKE